MCEFKGLAAKAADPETFILDPDFALPIDGELGEWWVG